MTTAGSGRYTNYTPLNTISAAAYNKRLALFNLKATADIGDFQADLVAKAKIALEAGNGDLQMFPSGVSMSYSTAPSLLEARVDRVGDPANPYVPDLSSPGAVDGHININPLEKTGNGSLAPNVIRPNYVGPTSPVSQESDSLGTQSPHLTSAAIGASPILKTLVKGKSPGSQGG